MSEETIRPAAAADLPALYDIWYASEAGDPCPPRGPWPWLAHELTTGELLLAERDRAAIGFAATITRSEITFLSDCFVRADAQSSGVGRRLLDRLANRPGPDQFRQQADRREQRMALLPRFQSDLRPRMAIDLPRNIVGAAGESRARLGEPKDG